MRFRQSLLVPSRRFAPAPATHYQTSPVCHERHRLKNPLPVRYLDFVATQSSHHSVLETNPYQDGQSADEWRSSLPLSGGVVCAIVKVGVRKLLNRLEDAGLTGGVLVCASRS